MNGNYIYSLLAVIVLFLLAYVGVEAAGLEVFFGVIIPYLAFLTFIIGFVYRILDWARSPVPFRIPSTCGQHKSLPWLDHSRIENPSNTFFVIVRMLLEIFCFRSLFRNTKAEIREGGKLSYEMEKWLWLGAIAFHYSFLTVLIRHLRFFTEPIPFFVTLTETLDGFLQVGLPGILISGFVLLAAVFYLFLRRILISQVKYISLAADFFPLFLIMGIAISGILMRYFSKIDVTAAKELAMGLVTFQPSVPGGIGGIFYVHLFFVSILMAYFPFSKLMHLGGIFFSPTRNMRGNTREIRHVNPWNYPVKVHTYDEYEEKFREKMIEAGVPVEKKE
ncbi:MAG TPA: sulfate reduction electron transfer complex DsrMKJOP subunit DsrM [Deltaproteobacteria bacterium]|nr:sulfate reduction electron transfer complex DsrMKJOP subunit DsrM [Deltaproteobacteria bacterium]